MRLAHKIYETIKPDVDFYTLRDMGNFKRRRLEAYRNELGITDFVDGRNQDLREVASGVNTPKEKDEICVMEEVVQQLSSYDTVIEATQRIAPVVSAGIISLPFIFMPETRNFYGYLVALACYFSVITMVDGLKPWFEYRKEDTLSRLKAYTISSNLWK